VETGRNVTTDPTRTIFTVPLYLLATGEQLGISTHNLSCLTLAVGGYCDDIDTYYLPQGTIRSEAKVSVPPDPQRPGFFLTATHPSDRRLEGTGIFAGRTGSVRVTGLADQTKFPSEVTLDEIYVIRYR
jgi:hypothetical protein